MISLASDARPVGTVSYRSETPWGMRDDTLFNYDLELPASFVPENTDGEVAAFERWDVGRVLDRMRTTDDFKFNVLPVNIDFAIRHGILDPDTPGYDLITRALHV